MPSPFPGMNPYLEHPETWPNAEGRFRGEFCREGKRRGTRSYPKFNLLRNLCNYEDDLSWANGFFSGNYLNWNEEAVLHHP
jgi:hypothetical protein